MAGNPPVAWLAVHLALESEECQQEVSRVLDDRKLEVLRAIVEDFVSTTVTRGYRV